jgi:hypothetical protein
MLVCAIHTLVPVCVPRHKDNAREGPDCLRRVNFSSGEGVGEEVGAPSDLNFGERPRRSRKRETLAKWLRTQDV